MDQVPPKYVQIAGHLRDQIVRGDLAPGEEVPSERELSAAWSVARPTAARALESLRRQGLVESRQGSGTYVRPHEGVPRARERFERARELGTMYGAGESVEFLKTGLIAGPAHVTDALGVPVGSRVAQRQRLLRGQHGRPIELSTSWFSAGLAEAVPGLLEPVRLPGGTVKHIGEVAGRRAHYARDQVTARPADASEREHLELAEPSAVLAYRLTVHDVHDLVLQVDDAVYPPGRWVFHQEYPITS